MFIIKVVKTGLQKNTFRNVPVISAAIARLQHSQAQEHGDAGPPRPETPSAKSLMEEDFKPKKAYDHLLQHSQAQEHGDAGPPRPETPSAKSVRRFFQEEVVPHHREWEKAGQVSREVWEKAGEQGLLGVLTPEEHGGIGGDLLSAAVVWEEQMYSNCSGPGFALHSEICMPYISNYGSKEQIERFIPQMTAGKCIGAIAMTEPGAGRASDLQNKVATQCLQLHGGWGYMWEFPIARAFVDSRIQPIYGGTNEIMKELITRTIVSQKLQHSQAQEHGDAGPPRPETSSAKSLMDIGTRRLFTEDHDLFRQNVRRFFQEEVVPHHREWEKAGQVSREVWEKAGEQGLLGVLTPEEHGGIGGDLLSAAVVWEEQMYSNCSGPGFALHSEICMPYISNYGSKEQIERFIPQMTAGKCIGAIAMTEPGAGSDLQGVRTYAKQDGSDWILNGGKVFITNGWMSDLCIVVTVTNREARTAAHGISLFLVETGMKGYHKGRKLEKIGLKAQDTAELFFEDVRLPASALLGQVNKGFYYLMNELPQFCEWLKSLIRDQRNTFLTAFLGVLSMACLGVTPGTVLPTLFVPFTLWMVS